MEKKYSKKIYPYLDFGIAFITWWCQVFLEAVLTVEVTLLFNKSNVLQRTPAVLADAHEMIWAPDFSQRGNKWTSVNFNNP